LGQPRFAQISASALAFAELKSRSLRQAAAFCLSTCEQTSTRGKRIEAYDGEQVVEPAMAKNLRPINLRSTKSCIVCIAMLSLCTLVCAAATSDNPSLRAAWLQAPKTQAANWDREPLLDKLVAGIDLNGYSRARVLSIFGKPGYSSDLLPEHTKIEEYRLSAANNKAFRIDYDAGSKVTSYSVEASGCECPLCADDAPELPAAVLHNSRLMRASTSPGSFTMAALEKMLGRPGKVDLAHNTVGGQVWLDYSETWRLEGQPHQFLIVDGHTPFRDAPTDEFRDKSALSWATVVYAPACLAN
jgi:hypothetical protein